MSKITEEIKSNENVSFRTEFNIPINLQNLGEVLIQNGYITEEKYHLDKFYYFIHKLNQSHLEDKSIKDGDAVALHSKILESLFGKDYYLNIIKTLKNLGMIEVDPSYQVNGKCKSYILTDQYKDQPSKYIERTGGDRSFIQKLLKFYNNKTTKFLYKKEYKAAYLNLTSVLLHEEKTIQALKNKCKELLINDGIIPTTLCSLTLEKAKNDLLFQKSEMPGAVKLAHWLSSVISVLKKEWWFSIDEKGFRVHTNITNMPKKLRQCLILDGTNDLVEIDIPASQLLFLAVKLKNLLGYTEYKVYKDLVKFIIKTVREDIYSDIANDLKLFPEDVDDDEREEIRKEFKGRLFKEILFGKTYPNETSNYFKKVYPTIYNYIFKLKKDNFRHCSIVLQKEESSYVYGSVIKEMVMLNPDIFFLSVHDSIIVKRSDLNMVYEAMLRLFFKKYGEKIIPKTTYYMKEFQPVNNKVPEMNSTEETILMLQRKNRIKEIEAQKRKEAEEWNDLFGDFMEIVYIDKKSTWDKKDLEELEIFCSR